VRPEDLIAKTDLNLKVKWELSNVRANVIYIYHCTSVGAPRSHKKM
jgi:hypothetical protein